MAIIQINHLPPVLLPPMLLVTATSAYGLGRIYLEFLLTVLLTPQLLTYRVAQKIGTIILYALILPSINRFSKLFHCQNQEKIRNNTITKDPTAPQVCRYTTLWNVKCLKSNNGKQDDFINNTF